MSISAVQYLSPQKLNILQQNTTQNLQIQSTRTELFKATKQSQGQSTLNPKDILLTNPARKKSKQSENHGVKLTNPAPVAVARRNARERNRVKQVNNGFATLRQHIPNSIASAFESSTGRGGSKKLSKVETLRMAVEYIRTLEDVLNGDTTDQSFDISENISSSIHSNSYNSLSSASTPSSSPCNSSNINSHTNVQSINMYSYPVMSPMDEDMSDDMSGINFATTPTPKTYQIPLEDIYDNDNLDLEENILSADQLIDGDLDLLSSMHTTGSLSPELYSDESLSPIAMNKCRGAMSMSLNHQMFIPVFNSTNEDIKLRITPEMIMEIKSEPAQEEEDSKENMVQVMQWWESQQTRS